MCYYCETQLPRRDTKGRIIPKHASINCKNWKNRAATNFKGVNVAFFQKSDIFYLKKQHVFE
jgi:hypothetical protein